MKKITQREIKHLSDLSGLEFDDESSKKMISNLEQILNFVDELGKNNNSNLIVTEHELSLNDLRDDEPVDKNKPSRVLNSKTEKNKFFSVPKVVD